MYHHRDYIGIGSKDGGKSRRAHDGLVTDLGVTVDGSNADNLCGSGKSKSSLKIGRMWQNTLNAGDMMRDKRLATVVRGHSNVPPGAPPVV